MSGRCFNCGVETDELYARVAIDTDGTQYPLPFCSECYDNTQHMNHINTTSLGYINLLPAGTPIPQTEYADDSYDSEPDTIYVPSTRWESILKAIGYVLVAVLTIAGCAIGGTLIDELVGVIVGGIVGFIAGVVAVALIMVISEISLTLKEILTELKIKD